MKNIEPKILKGFRDFLPQEARKRQYVIRQLAEVFEPYGFEPLETPALEYEEILLGKYGDEGDKLMYRFEDKGKRKVALRYDQTVPLARVVAQYADKLTMPFKRYQIQNVWRAENTQKGRFREFLQCDADIVGSNSTLSDSEVIAVAINGLKKLGFEKFKVLINDRNIFSYFQKTMNLSQQEVWKVIREIDKLKKIGKKGVIDELSKVLNPKQAVAIVDSFASIKPTETLLAIFQGLKMFGLPEEQMQFYPSLARGLDYYTGMIFEIEIEGYSGGSVCGGGRYDNLIGMFAGKQIPAVGFAFGFDRLMEAMEQYNLFPGDLITTKVLVTIFPASPAGGSKELIKKSLEISTTLCSAGVSTELYLDENAKMEKQLKYADQKGLPFVVIIGPDEASKNLVTLRNMKTRKQQTVPQAEIIKLLSS